jgi:hypothetical protein
MIGARTGDRINARMNARTAARALRWALVAAAVALGVGRAHAAGHPTPVVALRIVASPVETREVRQVVADLLSRIGLGLAEGPADEERASVDVEIDLSKDGGAPFVVLSTRRPHAVVWRRPLSAAASRKVLIESAAEVAYVAVESLARARGILPGDADTAPPAAPVGDEGPTSPSPRKPELVAEGAGAAPALRTDAPASAGTPGYGVDAAALGEMHARGLGGGQSSAGGGFALILSLRALRLAPAVALAVTYLRPIGAERPFGPADLSITSARLGAGVTALRSRAISLQLGPSLALAVVRGDASPSMPGPMPPTMMLPAGATSFSALEIWAGATARLALRVGGGAHLFLEGGADYELRQPGSSPPRGPGPSAGVDPGPFPTTSSSSPWRMCLLTGLAFTLAGQPHPPD